MKQHCNCPVIRVESPDEVKLACPTCGLGYPKYEMECKMSPQDARGFIISTK